MISRIVDSLNIFGMPDFLLAGIMGRGGGSASCLPATGRRWTGIRSCTGFVGVTLKDLQYDYQSNRIRVPLVLRRK